MGSEIIGNGQDIVSYMEYDPLGRQSKSYLPYAVPAASSNLTYRLNTKDETLQYYFNAYPDDFDTRTCHFI